MKFATALISAWSFLGLAGAPQRPVQLGVGMGSVRAPTVAVPTADKMPEARGKAPRKVQTVLTRYGQMLIPERCEFSNGKFDLIVHFHGAPTTMKPAFEKTGLNSVMLIVNLGVGSGRYEQNYNDKNALTRLTQGASKVVNRVCKDSPVRLDRVALSSWSAGYGAIYRMLMHKRIAERVDAVLLSDGLHAGFIDKGQRLVNPAQMSPFTQFAEAATKGSKLFAITHSDIKTRYASTSETASYLIEAVGLKRHRRASPGPRKTMLLTSETSTKGFSVQGFAGADTRAHCDHLYAIGETLFSKLRAHWVSES